MADWQRFNENLSQGFNSLMAQQLEQRKRQQDFNEALQMMMIKAQLEKQMNPLQQLLDMGKMGEALKNLGLTFQDVGFGGEQQKRTVIDLQNNGQGVFIPAGSPQTSMPNIRPTKFEPTPFGGIRPTIFEPVEIPTSESGKAALALQSIKDIEDVKSILFPKGSAGSYRRGIALGSNLPMSSMPFIPSNVGTYNPQTIFRKMGSSLSARQLIQTGVAARPDETAKLIRQFAPSGLMSSKAALEGLNELQSFYKTYLNILQTKGIAEADKWAQSQENLLNKGNRAPTQKGSFSNLWE